MCTRITSIVVLAWVGLPCSAAVLSVGPGKTYPRPCAAITAAAPGDTIEIYAAGDYSGDVCAWTKDGLILRGAGGRPRIDAAGRSSQSKAIWVISGNDTVVENIEFSGAAVADKNGAGIRQEGRNLTIRNCYFPDNEEGILAGDSPGSRILIEYSEFANNGAGDGFSHNLYINHVAQFTLRFCYSHHSKVGHLVKTRATENYILYNRLSDEAEGTGSYEINIPNGGRTFRFPLRRRLATRLATARHVLVQREMECGRSPLVSIPPNPRGSLRLPPAERGAAAGMATGFKKKVVGDLVHSRAAPERKTNWLRKEN